MDWKAVFAKLDRPSSSIILIESQSSRWAFWKISSCVLLIIRVEERVFENTEQTEASLAVVGKSHKEA